METKNVPRARLPEGAKEGDAMTEEDGALRPDRAETDARAARIKDKFNRLTQTSPPIA
jgi:hypothetical protein